MKNKFELFRRKMIHEGLPPPVIETFEYYYSLLVSGDTGAIRESEIAPLQKGSLPDYSEMEPCSKKGRSALSETAVIKLNGGLGTSMGLNCPKGLLRVKEEKNFYDITAMQLASLKGKYGIEIPSLLMNSFSTHEKTTEYFTRFENTRPDMPRFFLQNKFPKVAQDFKPVEWPQNPMLEWNPPGHGDIFTALLTSKTLERLIGAGISYIFVSNIDNLGAVLDMGMLGYFAENDIPFMIEVARRTLMDRKGGHLALRKKDGRLILRELAQTAPEDADQFQDIEKYRYFNTNSMWLNLRYLDEMLKREGGIFRLPMISNEKNLDPRDEISPKVFQIESAMCSAISLFPDAKAVSVPSFRFLPVKSCDDLIVLRSDRYHLSDDYNFIENTQGSITVSLDKKFYRTFDQLDDRFPNGAPSLLECASLSVKGDVMFGRDITIKNSVTIDNLAGYQVAIPDNTVIEHSITFS